MSTNTYITYDLLFYIRRRILTMRPFSMNIGIILLLISHVDLDVVSTQSA